MMATYGGDLEKVERHNQQVLDDVRKSKSYRITEK